MTTLTTTSAPLLKDLIAIPERVHQGDFVLKLADGLAHARATVSDYVVTPQLNKCFDDALVFIRSAVASRSSKAAYLHGSFGSGKSHFMAVLNLLLAGDVNARSIPELADVVVKHEWIQGKKFLMVPYHMVGANDLESAILGQYADHVRRLHPEASLPGFYLSETLFKDAEHLRAQLGDDAFFAKLNEGKDGGGDGWGDLDAGLWDGPNFEAATLEPPTGAERQRLIADLVRVYFQGYAQVAANRGEAFVSMDEGLAIMSQHAQALGYDAVVLFLDELILWLATHAANVDFVSREGSKLSKLVEAVHSRPIPLISFIARQRDLRELVGENLAGALQLQFADVLRHWEARFHRITLEDRNLPVIAQKRILKPVSATAKVTLDNAFDEFMKNRREVLDTLLGSNGEQAMFRQVYPFSPALVQTLIAVSSVLQRERTALRLMLQLLVDRRDELALGQIIPVGDLFDVIAKGDEPFSDAMRIHFENAKNLYRNKLLPRLEQQHGITWTEVEERRGDPAKAQALRNDARLIKTLLLAALVPEVEALKALTVQRLAALNHGSVRSPIPGRESQMVLTKLRDWASEIGEIKITDDNNPVISIHITGVDTDPILASVASEDNLGNRRRLIRSILFEALGLPDTDKLSLDYTTTWRGTRRQVNIGYDNVRELTDDRLRSQEGAWTVIFDYPFDQGYGPRDDIARLQKFKAQTDGRTDTIVWLPSFFSAKALRDLGTLVRLNYLMTGERFADHARYLSQVEREQARTLLSNQRGQLQQRIRAYIEVAYGIADEPRDAIDHELDGAEHLISLNGFKPSMPVGANLKAAFEKLLDQLMTYLYPAHPEFDEEVKPSTLRLVLEKLQEAIATPEKRLFIPDKAVRQRVRLVANPLRLGEMGETHFVLGHHWPTHFTKCHARHGGPMTVKALRGWMDEPQRMGLPREVQNLVILTFAEQTNRTFYLGTTPLRPTLESLDDDAELREQALPAPADWDEARRRASTLFGLTPAEVRNAANVSRLIDQLAAKASEWQPATSAMVKELGPKAATFGVSKDADRLVTARAAHALLNTLIGKGTDDPIHAFATAALRTSDTAMSRAMSRAGEISTALRDSAWTVFDALRRLDDHRRQAAEGILARVAEILAADEHVIGLKSALEEQHNKALVLLTDTPKPPPPPPPDIDPPVDHPDEVVIDTAGRRDLSAAEGRRLLNELDRKLESNPDCRLDLTWKIVRKGLQA